MRLFHKTIAISGFAILSLTACSTTQIVQSETLGNTEIPAPPKPNIEPIGAALKTSPAYVQELPPKASPETVIALYRAEASRVNRWINVGFAGLVSAVLEKEGQIETFSTALTQWHADTLEILKEQDAKNTEENKPETKFLGVKIK